MKLNSVFLTLLPALLFLGCTGTVERPAANSNSPDAAVPRSEGQDTSLKESISRLASDAKGRVGVGALNLESGEYYSLGGDGHYPMQSVYKLPISLAVVKMFEDQHLDLDRKEKISEGDFVGPHTHSPIRDKFPNGTEMSVRELIGFALEESDGTASDVLLRIIGGPAKVQMYLSSIGINDMKIVNTEKELGASWQPQYDNWSTPSASVDLLKALYERRALSSDAGREMILGMMASSGPGASRIRGELGDAAVAHKTGTSNTQNGITAATNDIGIVTLPNGEHMAIAVFVTDSSADEKTRESVIAKITKLIYDHWKARK